MITPKPIKAMTDNDTKISICFADIDLIRIIQKYPLIPPAAFIINRCRNKEDYSTEAYENLVK